MTTREQRQRRIQRAIARGRIQALARKGITFDKSGRARKGGRTLSTAALERAIKGARLAKRSHAARGPKPVRKPAPPARAKKPASPKSAATKRPTTKKPASKRPVKKLKKPVFETPSPSTTYVEELKRAEKKLKPKERAALKTLPLDVQEAAIKAMADKDRSRRASESRAKKEKEAAKEETREKKFVNKALSQLKKAVRAAAKDGGKLYGEYNEHTHKRQKVRGTFGGFKRTPFEKRADYIQEGLRKKYPKEWQRDLLVQSVHVREYLTQGDGGDGRRAIIEKTQMAGRQCIDEKCVDKKGKPLRVYQIYIGMIRVLIRKEDAGKYGGYATRDIDGKKIKAATDIRGLEGFETVAAGENPKAALDRILERLENHLDDILDGLPVVYVKSLQIKFDVEAQD